MPKFYLIYYKTLVDIALLKFFEVYNDRFVKNGNKYMLTENISNLKLEKFIFDSVQNTLSEIVEKYDVTKPKYYVVIGSCYPNQNILLSYKHNSYFPAKLEKLILTDGKLKYILKETDIEIGISKFNSIIESIYDKCFLKKKCLKRNIIFVKNRRFDCYVLFKVLKKILGKANCTNLHKTLFGKMKSPLYSVNDMINLYVHDKSKLNNDNDFKTNFIEVRQYLDQMMKEITENENS